MRNLLLPEMKVIKRIGSDSMGYCYYTLTGKAVQHRYALRLSPAELTFEKVFLQNTYIGKYSIELKVLSFKFIVGIQV